MNYVHYLQSKETVDDRALNVNVLEEFEARVRKHGLEGKTPVLRIVEVGCGIGSMFLRLLKRQKAFDTHKRVEYTMVDIKQDILTAAKERIFTDVPQVSELQPKMEEGEITVASESRLRDADISGSKGVHNTGITASNAKELCTIELSQNFVVRLILGDAMSFLKDKCNMFGAVIGAAVLDIWPLESALKVLLSALDKSSGLAAFYFPINFDGVTDFFPHSTEGRLFDDKVEAAFHRAMGTRTVLGRDILACQTGRRLVPCLELQGATVAAVGASAWTVNPNGGVYPPDEAFFLSCILDFIEATLRQGDGFEHGLDLEALQRYFSSRRQQVLEGHLYYLAHNIDVCGHV